MMYGWFGSDPQSSSSPNSSEGEKTNPNASTDPISEDKIDSFIASALGGLSIKEREKVYYEQHGVSDIIEENPQFVSGRLDDFNTELIALKERHKKSEAIKLAESISPDYVKDRVLRLKFLRAESFVAKQAADRMIRFFDIKLFLFGKDKLCKDITIKDLDYDDMATLEAGFMQLLPVRDRAGRCIFMILPSHQTYRIAENMTRAMYYILMSAMEDEESQKRGVAAIIYNVGDFMRGKTDPRTLSQGCWIQHSLPFKMCSLHHCFNDSAFRFIVNITMHFFSEEARARAKMHHGAHLECVYALMTFGIPSESIPVTTAGELKRKNHLEWVNMRRKQEDDKSGRPRIVVPSHSDILFGRGTPFREHIGNLKLYQLLDANLDRYEALKLKEKTIIIGEMVDAITISGGRFLKQVNGVWVEVDEKMAREKVSHAFRTRIRIASTEAKREKNRIPVARQDVHSSRMSPDEFDTVETKRARV